MTRTEEYVRKLAVKKLRRLRQAYENILRAALWEEHRRERRNFTSRGLMQAQKRRWINANLAAYPNAWVRMSVYWKMFVTPEYRRVMRESVKRWRAMGTLGSTHHPDGPAGVIEWPVHHKAWPD